jgi:hypothetical protein
MLALRYLSSSMPYQMFLEGPSKSFFKSFFLGTKLGQALQVMSMSKAVPEGLKNQECKKGNRKKHPSIPYVPVGDVVQEAISKGKDFSYNKLPDKTKFSVPIWDTGTQEAFLIHEQQAKSACKRKGPFQDYDVAIEAETKSVEQAKSLQKAIANAIGPKSKKDTNDPNQSSPDDLKASLKDTLLEKKVALEAQATAAEGFSHFMQTFSAKMPDFAGTRLSPVKLEQPHGPIYKETNTRKSMARVWSPFRIASPSTFWTCSPAMLPNSSASTLARC